MEYGITLIDKAKKMCGGLKALAEELDVQLSNLSAVAAGKKALPEEWVPGLAVIAGVDVKEAIHETRAERLGYNHPKVRVLEKKALHGVVAMLLFSVILNYSPRSTASEKDLNKLTSLYIVECWQRLRYVLRLSALRLSGLSHSGLRLPWLSHSGLRLQA
jgi:hypothetical protein